MTLTNLKIIYPLLIALCVVDFASRFFIETTAMKRAGVDEFTEFHVRQNIGDPSALRKIYVAAADGTSGQGATATDAGKFDSFTANGLTVALIAIYDAGERVAVLSVKSDKQKAELHRLHKNAEIGGYKLVELESQRIVLQNANHAKALKLFTPQKSNKDQ